MNSKARLYTRVLCTYYYRGAVQSAYIGFNGLKGMTASFT